MRIRSILYAAAAALVLLAVAGCSQPLVSSTTTTNTNGGTFTVLAQLNGQALDDLGQPLVGASVVYDSPELPVSSISRTITTVTTDSNGYFTVTNLQTGNYTFTVTPKTTTTGAVVSVNNMAATFTVVVPTLASLLASGATSTANSSNRTVVYSQKIYLPRLTGTINGVLYQNASTSHSLLVPVPKSTVLTMLFSPIDTSTTPADGLNLATGTSSTGGVTAIGLLYPTYNAATKAITTSRLITTTTDAGAAATAAATGSFTFSNLPLIFYGGSSNIGGTSSPIQVDLGLGTQINNITGNLATFSFPSVIKLGYYGTTPSLTIADTLTLSSTPYPALALVSTSTTDQFGNTGNNPATTAQIVLTFNRAVLATLPDNPLKDSTGTAALAVITNTTAGVVVPATVTGPTAAAPSTTITITPAGPLNPNSNYRVDYKVFDGMSNTASTPLTNNVIFMTLSSSTPPVAVTDLAIDTSFGKPSVFNYTQTSFNVIFTYNSSYTYQAQYSILSAITGVQGPWVNATISAPLVSGTGSTAYANITGVGAWKSGDTLSLRLVEYFAGSTTALGTSGTSVSNTLTIRDGIAPAAPTLSTTDGGPLINATATTTGVGFGNTYAAGTFVNGQSYVIATIASTDFTTIGASSNNVGTIFTSTGTGTSGTALPATISAAALTLGQNYVIANVGNTNWVSLGATANTAGLAFQATAQDVGAAPTGTAYLGYTAANIVAGQLYVIASTGSTNFTLIGSASNNPGTFFTATGPGTGSGIVYLSTATSVRPGRLIAQQSYTIQTLGSTNFTSVGAASNTIGLTFIANGTGVIGTAIGNSLVTRVFTTALSGSEVMSVPTVVFGSSGASTIATGAGAGATITVQINANPTDPIVPANTLATVTVTIPAGKTITGDTLSIIVKDGAGNQYAGPGVGGTIIQTVN